MFTNQAIYGCHLWPSINDLHPLLFCIHWWLVIFTIRRVIEMRCNHNNKCCISCENISQILNHFFIKYTIHGIVTQRNRRWVSWRFRRYCFSMLLYIPWYTFGKVRDTNLYSLLFNMIIKLGKLLSQIDSVVQKG